MNEEFDDDLFDFDYQETSLEYIVNHIVDWWLEDYSLEELFEEFDVTPQEAFLAVVEAGLIDEDDLEAYLTSDR